MVSKTLLIFVVLKELNKLNNMIQEQTRYYLFESTANSETKTKFVNELLKFSQKVQLFECGICETVIGITARFDDSCESGEVSVLDIIHAFRNLFIKKKEYLRKPNPQTYWDGEWVVFKAEN